MKFPSDRWGRPLDALTATLDYLEIGCQDPERTSDFYCRAMGYTPEKMGNAIIARALDRKLIFSAGEPKTLLSAGFAVPDDLELDRIRQRLQSASWEFEVGATLLFRKAIIARDPDGNQFAFGLPTAATMQGGPDLPTARLQHVVLASRDPARIVRFFVDVLGFTLSDDVLDDEGGVRTSFLRCSEEHHSFAVFLAPEDRFDHHCYETSDWNAIRDWADHMAQNQIKIQWGPGRHGPGNNLFIFVHDPDGNWVEISAELQILEHDHPTGQWPHEQRTLNSWGQGLLRS